MSNKRFQARHGVDNNNQTLSNVATPVNATDAANKAYVDSVGTTASNAIPLAQKGVANGVATLDSEGLIPTSQLPSYVDEVQEYPSLSAFPTTGQSDKIYVATDVHKIYRWSGSEYIDISASAGTADEATKLATARTIALSGDVTGSTSFDGSQNVTISVVYKNSGVTAGTYPKVTVDAKGNVTSGSSLSATDIPALDASKITSGTLTVGTSGNAATATKLATARTINGVSFDGTANITVADATKLPLSGGTLTGELVGTNIKISTADTTTAASHYYVETGSDGYIRPKTLANVRSEICTSISNDTTTNATYYPVFATGTSGAMTAARVSNTKLTFNPSTGDLSATNFNSLSDINYKENIKPVQHAVDTIQKMNGYSYDWKDGSGSSYGVIAQELIEILPNAVTVNDGKHAVNYSAIIPFLIEAIKEQQREIEQLKAKLQ